VAKAQTAAIELIERPEWRAICETEMVYEVKLNGKHFARVSHNMRGYSGSLPALSNTEPPALRHFDIGEMPISRVRREIRKLNAEQGECLRALVN